MTAKVRVVVADNDGALTIAELDVTEVSIGHDNGCLRVRRADGVTEVFSPYGWLSAIDENDTITEQAAELIEAVDEALETAADISP
jgi:hypothetical protein